MNKWLKKDWFLFGVAMGLIIPTVVFWVLYVVVFHFDITFLQSLDYLVLIAAAFNLFPLRYYLVTLHFDKTGRGILAMTFVLVIGFFALSKFIS